MTGYQKLASLMVKHDELASFQRFEFLNTLNILYLQAELVHLEGQLKDSMKEDLESGTQVGEGSSGEADGSEILGGNLSIVGSGEDTHGEDIEKCNESEDTEKVDKSGEAEEASGDEPPQAVVPHGEVDNEAAEKNDDDLLTLIASSVDDGNGGNFMEDANNGLVNSVSPGDNEEEGIAVGGIEEESARRDTCEEATQVTQNGDSMESSDNESAEVGTEAFPTPKDESEGDNQTGPDTEHNNQKRSSLRISSETNSVRLDTASSVTSQDMRRFSARDWWCLSKMEGSETWKIMLQTRERLKEYNEAILQQAAMKTRHSPSTYDLKFLQYWFHEEGLGHYPLLGSDSELWIDAEPKDLIAVEAYPVHDPLAAVFANKVWKWWHDVVGHRLPDTIHDEESGGRYYHYRRTHMLRMANIAGSSLSTAILVGSITTLYLVKPMEILLCIVAVFTLLFSLALISVTNATKAEVFPATAAFVAVQVVFVGSSHSNGV